MKPAKVLLIGGLLVFAFIGLKGLDFYEKISFDFTGLKIIKSGSGFFNTEILTNLIIKNPTQTVLRVDSVTGTAMINGEQVGKYYINRPFTVLGNAKITVPMKIQTTNVNLVKNIIINLSNRVPIGLDFHGQVNSSFGVLPFTKKISFA